MKRIGFIGFGEVGFTFAKGIRDYAQGKCTVYAYDANQDNDWQGKLIHGRANEAGVTLVKNMSELIEMSDIILGLIPASISVKVASQLADELKGGQVYCDLSSASPSGKIESNKIISKSNATYIDGAIMGSMLSYGFNVPIFISGPSAANIVKDLANVGFNVKVVGENAGAASTIKMLRASFTKGIEALIFETFYAASISNVEDIVLEILADTFDKESFCETVNRYLTSGAIHAKRRAEEVAGVIGLLESIGVEAYMAQGTYNRLSWVAEMGLKELYGGITPKDYRDVLNKLKEKNE